MPIATAGMTGGNMNWFKRAAKKELDFDLSSESHTLWRELLFREQDRVNIKFDEENDDSVSEVRDIQLGVKESLFNEKEYRVRAQMWSAGGDWESPIVYFRCQLFNGTYPEAKFIYIPSKAEGNMNLVKSDKGERASDGDDYEKRTDADEKKLWKALKDYAKDLAKRYDEDSSSFNSDGKPYVKDMTKLV
jgi:hypothetical protein